MDQSCNESLPRIERQLATELRALIAESPVGSAFDVAPSSDFCYLLELFIPGVLRRHYLEWSSESLDGIFAECATKTGRAAAVLTGSCILVSDQTVTPFMIELAASSTSEGIASYRVCVGEAGGGRLGISGPPCNSPEAKENLELIASRIGSVVWSYEVSSNGNH